MQIDESHTATRRNYANMGYPSGVPKTPVKSPGNLTRRTVANMIYRAPQALIRSDHITKTPVKEDKVGNTRRRRHREGTSKKNPASRRLNKEIQGFLECQVPPSPSMHDTLPDAPIWGDEEELLSSSFHRSMPDMYHHHHKRSPTRRGGRSVLAARTIEDLSENFIEDESFNGSLFAPETHQIVEEKYGAKRACCYGKLLRYASVVQFLVFVGLGIIIYDSHHKVRAHREKIELYDEERAHMLEQMMWIDKAAKKVHQKFGPSGMIGGTGGEQAKDTSKDEGVLQVRNEIERLQVRIQLNARQYLERRFGEKLIHVTLSLGPDSSDQITIALSEDTPHAASTLIQQMDQKLWDGVVYQKLESGAIQALSGSSSPPSPILEFVEKSRGCHKRGSVALHQLDDDELHVLVLRIHLDDDTRTDESDVCIGTVLEGLEHMDALQSLPLIHDRED